MSNSRRRLHRIVIILGAINRKSIWLLLLAVTLLYGLPPSSPQLAVTEYPVPFSPGAIIAGPDGALWFRGQLDLPRIGRITTSGSVTQFILPPLPPNPPPFNNLGGILRGPVVGPDGALWFTEDFGNLGVSVIGRMTTAGAVTEFQLPGTSGLYGAAFITGGPDGALWFTYSNQLTHVDSIQRITVSGTFTAVYTLPNLFTLPGEIVTGPDGALWFTEGGYNKIGRITTAGSLTEYSLPSETFPYVNVGLTVGADGAMWFLEASNNRVARITTSGVLTEYPIPSSAPGLAESMTAGPDGVLWFTNGNDTVNRVALDGTITGFSLPSPITVPTDVVGIATGPDGNLWISLANASKIGKFSPAQSPPLPVAPAPSTLVLGLLGLMSVALAVGFRQRRTSSLPPAFVQESRARANLAH